ncbi:protein tlpB [Flavobacterium sp. F372]|uniref:Protein tlpB n=1 Tax=Flavobacterium bernardetii TaxID=2813823 RepID=A0ABR7IX91_9FLAO|nr:MauE/DoxX family redox-associated membrane protein [Flavobacterium bernardetii]MBC5834399.1 protein tlpB [Flavobacterium bernardetii]NHF69962.1 protein tlpB [Flavobacterium bernardetii]
MNKKNISWTLRIVIALLFIVSAIAKISKGWISDFPFIDFSPYFAISTFEVKQLLTLGFSEAVAPYFSRILIGIEFALGFLLLNNNFLKRITIPATIGLLVVFIIHLSYVTFLSGGNSGNCGCFGELIPMTPIEAIIKNIIAVGLLVWLWKIQENDKKSNFWILTTVTLACILGLFMLAPMKAATTSSSIDSNEVVLTDTISQVEDTVQVAEIKPVDSSKVKVEKNIEEVKKEVGPKPVFSGYSEFYADIDNGKKILCFFVPGCEHCRDAARDLNALQKKHKDFPQVQIVFMDEEAEKIPDFFKYAGKQFPYKVIDVIPFWTKLGSGKDTPGIVYLHNGNVIKFYDGIAENAFNSKAIEKVIYKK